MKCVIVRKEGIVVFETDKINYMKKRDYDRSETHEIIIGFDNGTETTFSYDTIEKREEEWQRIMKCWRSDEEQDNTDTPHTC